MANDSGQIKLKALIADDDLGIRKLVAAFLAKEGFACDLAEDGEQAWKLASEQTYHAVITDLAMPKRHGHSLAVELLTLPNRPVVIVLTGLIEPRLAKDLLARGVDDVQFKPVRFAELAAQVKALVNNRPAGDVAGQVASSTARHEGHITAEELDECLHDLAHVPSVAQAAVNVFRLTADENTDPQLVSNVIMRDPALIAEVLKLGNSSCFNTAGKKTSDVTTAIVRLGLKRVGDLALTLAAYSTVSQERIPFFPLRRVWRKCLAAGICIGKLVDQAGVKSSRLQCAAMLQPIGRMILATSYPDVYRRLIAIARKDRRSLCSLEAETFPLCPGAVAAKVLGMWGIPEEIHRPLTYTSLTFSRLTKLPDAIRHSVELVKTACYLGALAAEHFEPWDLIDPPPNSLLLRLGVQDIDSLVSSCRAELDQIVAIKADDQAFRTEQMENANLPAIKSLPYKRLQADPVDCIPHLLANAQIRLIAAPEDIAEVESELLINALDAALPQVIARLRSVSSQQAVVLVNADHVERLQGYGRILALPTTYGLLTDICRAISQSDRGARLISS